MSRTNKKQLQEHHDLQSTADNTRKRSENKKLGEHEQIQMEKAGERKVKKVNRIKGKAGNDDNKMKARVIAKGKWERKKYLQECDSVTIKDVIQMRLHMFFDLKIVIFWVLDLKASFGQLGSKRVTKP